MRKLIISLPAVLATILTIAAIIHQPALAQNVTTSTQPPIANQSLLALVPTTVSVTQLRAEDPLFNNFVTVADDCLNQYADPAYNVTNPTSAPVCFQVINEAYTKWCGLEEHHADKCFVAERAQQSYLFLSSQ